MIKHWFTSHADKTAQTVRTEEDEERHLTAQHELTREQERVLQRIALAARDTHIVAEKAIEMVRNSRQ